MSKFFNELWFSWQLNRFLSSLSLWMFIYMCMYVYVCLCVHGIFWVLSLEKVYSCGTLPLTLC